MNRWLKKHRWEWHKPDGFAVRIGLRWYASESLLRRHLEHQPETFACKKVKP